MDYTLEKFDSGMHYIMLDGKTVEGLLKGGNKRAICRLNGAFEYHCAIMHKKEGGYFVNVGSAIRKKLKIKEGAKVKAEFYVDATPYQFEASEEFAEVLAQDAEADKIFHSLTAGNQRGLIYLVIQVKSVDKRIERALKIAEKLKMGITSPREIIKSW